MAYYGNLTEQELGFDAFIAPDDFDRTAQPVDIYEVFKREYVLNNQARYIYYYSDGNYPLTLTPTTGEYYKYGYRTGGVDVVVDIPLSTEGGIATTIWGASGNTSGSNESGFTHRWVIVYRVSTAKFSPEFTDFKAIWLYAGDRVNQVLLKGTNVFMRFLHYANLNSMTTIVADTTTNGSNKLEGSINIPETVSAVGIRAYAWSESIIIAKYPLTKDVSISHELGFVSVSRTIFELHFGASTSVEMSQTAYDSYTRLRVISTSFQNLLYTSFDGCDIIYTKDKTRIALIAKYTVRGLCLPDELPQSQIDLLGTKLSANIMANHQLYIGNQITNLTNLYLSNKSFTTIEVGEGNTAFSVQNGLLISATGQLIKAGTYNTGDLIIPNTVTEILANSFLRCSGYNGNLTIPSSVTSIASDVFYGLTQLTSLTLPPNYDTSIYNVFGFANFSAESLNTSILNLMGGTSGSPKWFNISKTSLDALNAAYPNAVSNAALRFINVRADIIQDASLKLWLDASNPLSYPGTGTLWSDLSGNGNNGTMVNGVAYSTANGGVMSFDGVNDFVNRTNAVSMPKGAEPRTFSVWCNTTRLPSGSGLFSLIAIGANTDGNLFALSIALGKYFLWGSTTNYMSSFAPTLNQWESITVVYNGTFIQIYKNGVPDSGGNITLNTANSNLYFIGGFSSFASPYPGMLNDATIYNRALTPEEVNQNFQVTRNKYNI